MSEAVDELLNAVREHNSGNETPPAEPTAEAVAVETPEVVDAPPAPEKARFTSLDDVILDDPRLPESLRGQPASVLFQDRTKGWEERHQLGFQKNRLEAERDTALTALEKVLQKFSGNQPKSEPAPVQTKPIDRLRSRGVEPVDVLSDAERTLTATIEASSEEAAARLVPQLEAIQKAIEEIKSERAQEQQQKTFDSYRTAWETAKPAHVPIEAWNGQFADYASAFVLKNSLPLNDASSYAKAWETFTQNGVELLRYVNPNAEPAPVASAPAAPAPPVGGGKPATPVQKSKPSSHLNNHQRHAYSTIAAVFERAGTPIDVDAVLEDVKADPTTRSFFQ